LTDDTVDIIVRLEEGYFRATLHGGDTIDSHRVLLAIGVKDVWPDIPGLEQCYGETAHVCPDCDGYEARNKKVVVIGTGRKGAAMALALMTWTTEIIICTNGRPADLDEAAWGKLEGLNIPVLEAQIIRIRAQHSDVYALDLDGGVQLDCERIFFAIAQYPSDDLGMQLGCKRDDTGRIIVDKHYHTSVQGVYAAGDIAHGSELAAVAVAGGAVAAVAIHHSLLPEERRLE
jgi:thioredoxin reductase